MSSADDEGRIGGEAAELAADPVDKAPEPPGETAADAPVDADAPTSDSEGTGVDSEIGQQEPVAGETADAGAPESAPEPAADDAPAAEAAAGDTAPAGEPADDATTPDQPPGPETQPPGENDIPPATEAEVPTADPGPEPEPEPVHDDDRSPLLELLGSELDDGLVDSVIVPGRDIVVRVSIDRWVDAARVLRDKAGMTYFCFLNAIDWLPSPYGKNEGDAVPPPPPDTSAELAHGTAGGETRFQLLARLERPGTAIGITLKADVDDAALTAPSWIGVFAGADWHERETHEMFGITFEGHPYLENLYLPGGFEGYPMRKDYPLLSRMVKPWPGLVDVEAMPGEPEGDEEATEEVST